jgi:hypothetical protein
MLIMECRLRIPRLRSTSRSSRTAPYRGLRQSLKSYVLLLTYVLVLANRRSLLGDAANGGYAPSRLSAGRRGRLA